MICKHYYVFENPNISGKLNRKQWDSLRLSNSDKAFSIENTLHDYELNCLKHKDYIRHAKIIAKLIKSQKSPQSTNIISFGCGKGILEWHLSKMIDSKNTLSDFAADGLNKLRNLLGQKFEFLEYDLLNGNKEAIEKYDTAIMYRLSTEFSIKDWKKYFLNFVVQE